MPTPLEIAHQKRQQMKEAGIEIKRKTPLEKLKDNPKSLRAAINAMCYQCEGEDVDPNIRKRIGECGLTDCALHAVRPYQQKSQQDEQT